MNRSLLRLSLVVAVLAFVFTAVATGSPNRKIWCAGNICVADDGGISPNRLPRHGKAPVTARLNAEISTRDGSHPPAFESMDLKVEKNISIDPVGLPTCRAGQLQATSSAAAKQACGEAVVRYADVALLAAIAGDDLIATSLRQLYLTPLERARDGGKVARETLRAYFEAERNVSSTAAALGVDRRTVRNRLGVIEDLLGRPIKGAEADLEIALRLDD
jgi:ActR/RegA family two-component response regulator